MVSGQGTQELQHEQVCPRSSEAMSHMSDMWNSVKQEPRWVEYVSDDDNGPGNLQNSPSLVEPLELAESSDPSITIENLDLPDLDFPVPAHDLIPEMVRETDLGATSSAQTDVEVDAFGVLIPIQGSIVAHSRSGRSIAAVTERRVKNTEAARRSRARRSDKLLELRKRNEELSKRNVTLIAENERLRAIVRALEDKLHLDET